MPNKSDEIFSKVTKIFFNIVLIEKALYLTMYGTVWRKVIRIYPI